jgi:hypothetical protein
MATYLSRTQSSSNQKIFTISTWVKRANITDINYVTNIAASGQSRIGIIFQTNQLMFYGVDGGGDSIYLATSALFRDTSAFYHITVAVDTTQATASDRAKLYVNGTRVTAFAAENYCTQNFDFPTNNPHYVGCYLSSNQLYNFYGVMSHYHYCDGYAYDASTFGESDSVSGIWKPKTAPSVTYGTNGFFLKFENSGAMGTDSSGNGNNFTVSGTLTQNVDTPSNNFTTGNPLYFTNTAWTTSLSNGNNTFTGHTGSNSYPMVASTIAAPASGKFYAEFKVTSSSQNYYVGVATPEAVSGTAINAHYPNWDNEGGTNAHAYSYYGADGQKYVKTGGGATSASAYGSSSSQNDILGIALDLDNNKLYIHKNGTYFDSGNPASGASGTGAISVTNHEYLFFMSDGAGGSDASGTANFGQGYFGTTQVASAGTAPSEGGIFEYDCPTGYQALCTKGINSF